MLPAGAILAADESHFVFLLEEGKAVKYRVQVGRADGGTVAVLNRRRMGAPAAQPEPFTGAEKVVVGNLGALADGVAVEVAN